MKAFFNTIGKSENGLAGKVYQRFVPHRPAPGFEIQADKLSDRLFYENWVEDEGRHVVVLSDGALGTMWELEPIAHEAMEESQLIRTVKKLGEVFAKSPDSAVSMQVIADGQDSDHISGLPGWVGRPDTFARKAFAARVKAIQSLAENPGKRPMLVRRRVFLTLRVESGGGPSLSRKHDLASALKRQAESFAATLQKLREHADRLEQSFGSQVRKDLLRCRVGVLISLLRDTLHSDQQKKNIKYYNTHDVEEGFGSISKQAFNGEFSWSRDGVGVGGDTWEVLSWSDKPALVFEGMLTELMKVNSSLRCIVNIRPTNYLADLEGLAEELKEASDAYQEKQQREVRQTENRIAEGEKLIEVSFHLMCRNKGLALEEPKEKRFGEKLVTQFTDTVPVFVERFNAYPAFMSCLPFGYSGSVGGLVGRELRILSGDLGCLLPVFCGSRGVSLASQLMQSRAGESLWLNPRAAETNPHLARFGPSGSGKSFNTANQVLSEIAFDPDLMTVFIDSLTSYKYLAYAIGEDGGCKIIVPPDSFPNPFAVGINPARMQVLVSTIDLSVSLVSGRSLDPLEQIVLTEAIALTYEENTGASTRRYIEGSLGEYEDVSGEIELPRMSQIVTQFASVCAEKGIDKGVAQRLYELLMPFHGNGTYAVIWDQLAYQIPEERAPAITIYDLGHIQSDKKLATMVSVAVVNATDYQFGHPVNKGRAGALEIEEAGVTLGGTSELLEAFVQGAFIRYRKAGIRCAVTGNDVEQFTNLPAARAAWRLSANRLILPTAEDDVRDALCQELLNNPGQEELVRSLEKVDGAFSEFLWLSDAFTGTGAFVPTGLDYWLAINKPQETEVMEFTKSVTGSYQQAAFYLAENWPLGLRCERGRLRALTDLDKAKVRADFEVDQKGAQEVIT